VIWMVDFLSIEFCMLAFIAELFRRSFMIEETQLAVALHGLAH